MSNTTSVLPQTERALAEAFCAGMTAGAAEQTSSDDNVDHWWRQRLSIGDDAFAWVGAPAESWEGLGKHALVAAGIDEPETTDIRQTYQELLQQGLSALAQAIGSQIGKEVTCEEGEEKNNPPEFRTVPVEVEYDEGSPVELWVSFSPTLLAGLEKGPTADLPPQSVASRTKALTSALASGSEAMALLLDVELPVSVSFGRAHLPIKDVLKLASGSIVELNRAVAEPVEVIVNNCVIARGEVVVVEGNYGVRITQIISRRERLRTLN